MQSFVDDAVLRFATVEEYLGDRETRFFGEGYKRATYRLSGIESADGEGGPVVSATAAVGYPADWSRKGTIDQLPHLSTIDVLLLGVQLAEIWLARHAGLGEQARRSAWIREAHIKAGSSPVEEELTGFAVTAARSRVAEQAEPGRVVSTLDCQVGSLRLRVDVDHVAAGPDGSDELGDQDRRPYGDGHKARLQRLRDVVVAADRLSATARVELPATPALPGVGVEGDFQPSVSLVDAFVVALQLGQVLLYELDGVTRADSNTLWMRSTRWQAESPVRPDAGTHPVVVELRDAALLHNRKGETWRRADIVSELGGVTVVCSVAHQLPIED
ncbi:AvrD family protein [Lentzea kentuckyensis]|uniref:AvrD family protein n=1 Tax=Lentzea kentuckyensis TaxID=360086 RepID=UPI000A38112E|nr:AvrD family protein [Lentzea kentuckyensis]